jgi:hypothetical protein
VLNGGQEQEGQRTNVKMIEIMQRKEKENILNSKNVSPVSEFCKSL